MQASERFEITSHCFISRALSTDPTTWAQTFSEMSEKGLDRKAICILVV